MNTISDAKYLFLMLLDAVENKEVIFSRHPVKLGCTIIGGTPDTCLFFRFKCEAQEVDILGGRVVYFSHPAL
jgi:hypothetical protein